MPGASLPNIPPKKKLQTLAEAKASAPKPKGKPTAGKELVRVPKKPAAASIPSKLAKVGKFVTKKSVLGTAALLAAEPVIRTINNNSKQGRVTPTGGSVGGKGGGHLGFIPAKTNMGKNPIQKGTFKGPNKPIASTKYRVETGDTLSGIAKRAGVTLAELRAANPQLKGKGIFRNTGVNIPSKGKKPSPEYTGPVPFRPGSAAAKAYEAKRKKK